MNMRAFVTSHFFRYSLVFFFTLTPIFMMVRLLHGIWMEGFTIPNSLLYVTTIVFMLVVTSVVLIELSQQIMMGRLRASMGKRFSVTRRVTHNHPYLTALPPVPTRETARVGTYTVMRCYRTIERTLQKIPFIFSVSKTLHLFLVVSHLFVFYGSGQWMDMTISILSGVLLGYHVLILFMLNKKWYSKYPTELYITGISDVVRLDKKIPVISTTYYS